MINEHYFVETQGADKSNYVINVKKPPFMVARVYKWRTSSNGSQEVKNYMAKFPNSVQVEGYNVVLTYDSTIQTNSSTPIFVDRRFQQGSVAQNLAAQSNIRFTKVSLYREEIDIELHRMAEFYLKVKIDNAMNYYKHFKV